MGESYFNAFLENATKNPQKAILVSGGKVMTFRELDQLTSEIARVLDGNGIGRGSIVPILMSNEPRAIAAMLGVHRTGAAFCFVDPEYPRERIDFIVKDTGAKLIIDSKWVSELGTNPVDLNAIESAQEDQRKQTDFPPAKFEPDDLAFVVYTSGSTGAPKGVMLPYHAMMRSMRSFAEMKPSCSEEDSFLLIAALSFVGGVALTLYNIYLGETVHMLTGKQRKDGKYIAGYIIENKITDLFLPPQMAAQLLPDLSGHIKFLIVASDRVVDIYDETMTIYNSYGLSESCGPITAFKIDRAYPEITPIGNAAGGSRIYILDDDLKEVPEGEIGEICIAGQIAIGYLNLPELTARRFVKNPYSDDPEFATLFLTGDLGKLDENKMLRYVQRKDWMVKVRGYRVEPGEIEAAMVKYGQVKQAVVTSFTNAQGETALYGIYTADRVIAPAEVKKAISSYLPDYMMPAFMEQLESLPLNPNGKVDRKNIAPPEIERFKADYVAPENDVEKEICQAFETLLGAGQIGADDDFVLLGGDSVTAVKLQTVLQKFGFGAADILRLRTPRALAELKGNIVKFEKSERREKYPLTPAERQMAAESGLDPESCAYNINMAVKLKGELDVSRLGNALQQLVERHAVLRSFYPIENGEFVHRIAGHVDVDMKRVSHSIKAKPKEDTPYDITKAPLFRFTLYDEGDSENILHIGMHHIIIDGTGFDTLLKDLFAFYNGEPLPPVEFDYLDYACWQENHMDYSESEAYFKDVFAKGLPENEMPTKPIRPEKLPVNDTVIEATFSSKLLDETAKLYKTTSYTILVSAAALTVSKYCASNDVILGLAMSGRTLPQTAAMPGMFVNTAPIRTAFTSEQSAADFTADVSARLGILKKHQCYPFERLLQDLDIERDISRHPVYDVMINYLHELRIPDVPGLEVSEYPLPRQLLEMDISIEFLRRHEEVLIQFSYSKQLYEDEVAENMLEQLVSILSAMAENTKATLLSVMALPARQERQLLVDFQGKKDDTNKDTNFIELFDRQVRSNPDKAAIVYGDKTLSYAELDDVTNRLAAHITGKGIGAGQTVSIMVGRSEMMMVCAIGVLKSGAAYQPLDPKYPEERLSFMIGDASAAMILADRGMNIPPYKGDILFTDEIYGLPDAGSPNVTHAKDDNFVLLYTSGTTGNPKGVFLSHANIISFCTHTTGSIGITAEDATFAYASFGFDAHIFDNYPALMNGCTVHVIPEEMRLNIKALDEYLAKNSITYGFITTQLGRQFAEMERTCKLRYLSTGGETLVPIAPPDGLRLSNVYGPTETSVMVTEQSIDKLYDRVPIGKPYTNTAIYAVDKMGELTPVGVAGELLISGRQVSKGYLNRPDLTAEKFIANKFSDDPDYSVSYKTGDIGRYLPNGSIDIAGRNDFQVKIRGFRVELPEIEGRIRQHPDVSDAAVVALDAPGGGKCAVAYVVSEKSLDTDEINAFILEKLPPQMVPSATMQIDAIPLNPNGKVDRRKLPPPVYQAASDEGEDQNRPMNQLETRLFEITNQLLGHDQFGLTTDLFKVGLASLSAIKLTSLIDKEFGFAPTVKELMSQPNLLAVEDILISHLLSGERGKTDEKGGMSEKKDRDYYPLTANQLGVYLDCMKTPSTTKYNVPFRLELPAETDAKRLKDAISKVLQAHPGLQIQVASIEGEICQTPLEELPEIVIHHVGKGSSETAGEDSIETAGQSSLEALCENFVMPFNLYRGPLYKIEIFESSEIVAILCDFHHIIFDGGSIDIFISGIIDAYNGKEPAGERISALEWSIIEKDSKNTGDWLADKAYFDEKLKDFDGSSEISPDVQSGGQPGALKEIEAAVDRSAVESFCKENGVTPAGLFLAATSYAVSRWVNAENVYMAAISSGRSDVRLFDTVGMLVRTIPIAISRLEGQTVIDYIRDAQDTFINSVAHEGYAFTEIAERYGYTPSIMYTCELGIAAEEHELLGHKIRFKGLGLEEAKFKLSVHIEEREGRMVFAVQYDDNCYSQDLMAAFTETLCQALSNMIQAPKQRLAVVSILSGSQRDRISGFNCSGEANIAVLHKMFEQAAAESPGKIALIAADRSYTYKELDECANRLANGLIKKGVVPGDKVAFMLKRTGRILVSMLGIMKAGAAYIPLDPEYPQERINHVLEDSQAKLLLKESDVDALMENQRAGSPDIDVTPDMLAYIIYTSGSTGKPKGVMLQHGGISNYCTAKPENIHVWGLVNNASIMLSITTVAFDMFLKESMTSLCNGLTLVLADEDTSHDPVRLVKLFEDTGADAFNTTPSVMLEFTNFPPLLEKLRECKVLMAGAEKYPEALLARMKGCSAKLFNTYGPTEITVSCNCKELDLDSKITVGKPLLGVSEQVVDTDGNALPSQMTGELYVAGCGVARGYVNLTEQTNQRFVMMGGKRYYKTGDLARWTQDGEIEIFGRNDGQIKLRGLRVELGEIEKTILDIEGIRSCAVIIRKIGSTDHICAYFVSDKDIEFEEIRKKLALTLTAYMIPTAYCRLEKMPKTPNGKTDFKALPEAALLGSGEYAAPSNELEQKLCDVFQRVLGLERVSVLDNFFDVGGTSLAVTRVIIESENMSIRGKDGQGLAYSDVFANPTPRGLAQLLDSDKKESESDGGKEYYDYTQIDALLRRNTLKSFMSEPLRPLGNVLLTGSTGFLGIHVLHELLTTAPRETTRKIVCLVRRSKKDSVENRLRKWLFYYFSDTFEDDRLVVVEGDMTDEKALALPEGISINTVINCAANVSHFAVDTKAFDVNSRGVERLIDLCREHGARLIQVSTASIAGIAASDNPAYDKSLNENMLYFGQSLENQYIYTKFVAERMILQACAEGLDAKIMRVGNLMARASDNEFQANALSNNFLGRLRAFEAVGCFPFGAFTTKVELAPVDITAQSILLLAQTAKDCRVFHPYNNHYIFLGDIILAMKEEGIPLDLAEQAIFEEAIVRASKDASKAEKLVSLIAYQNGAGGKEVKPVSSVNEYTAQVLLRLGMTWPETSAEYQRGFVRTMIQMGVLGGVDFA